MRHPRLAALLSLLAASGLAGETAVFLEVRNTGPRRFQQVAEHRAPLEKLFPHRQPMAVRVVETDGAGKRLRDGVGQFDREPGGPGVISLLLDGVSAPGQRRWFRVVPSDEPTSAATDLRLDQTRDELLVSNQFFTAHVARQGRGGFPDIVEMNGSGSVYRDFFYGDRLYAKARGSRHLREDPYSTARVAARGPLRIVIETKATYPGTKATAVYRYVYRAWSPVVDVSCTVTREDDYEWSEIHFLQVSRRDTLLGRWVGGDPPKQGAFANAKQATNFARWGVMHNADDAVGLGFAEGVMLYDGIDYCNYLQTPVPPWTTRTFERAGRLYFGPAQRDPRRYAELLAGDGLEVRQLPLPEQAVAPEVVAKYRLESAALALEFADEAHGLGLVRLTNRLAKQALVEAADEKPLLWRIELRGKDQKPVALDNRAQAKCKVTAFKGALNLQWDAIDLGDEPGAISVLAIVELLPGAALSSWRLEVKNRSKRYGVWDVLFPAFSKVGPDERPDVAVPRSNWGMLYHAGKHRQAGRYPSANWPMQFLTVNRGEAGLYLACHDPEAWPKQFSLTPMGEFHFRIHAPNQGLPGTGFDMPFPIVVGACQGDWWQGAKLYRQWVLAHAPWTRKGPLARRKDVPKKLLELGLWMLGSGDPKAVVPKMHEAAKLFRVPIGIHWYNWHEIPFDTYYPNYFPTKPGFADAVKELTDAGMVVMPYINGRLWDSGNANFKEARPFAAKKPDGEPYIEFYGSKRPLACMCPATEFWQKRVQGICRRLMTECGVNAIYLDQIAAAGPQLCYDKSHGHPLGGGSWWVDGYRKMLTPIRQMAHADGRDVILTTENNAEPYMDNVDCLLTWNPRYDHEIPMVSAVYSGYVTYFSSPCNVGDELTAFAMSQGRDWLWGCQLGWMGFELLDPKNREKAAYLRDLAQHRLAAAKFMHLGELLGELKPLNDVPEVEVTWGRGWGAKPVHQARLPAVMATLWRAPDGQLAVAVTNWDDRPHLFRFRLDPGTWTHFGIDGKPPSHVLLTRLGPRGPMHEGFVRYGAIERTLTLRQREVRVLALSPAPEPKELLDALAEQIRTTRPQARVPRLSGSEAARCRALLAVPGDPKAMMAPLGVRLAKRCALDVLLADMGLEARLEPAEVVAASEDWFGVKLLLRNSGKKRLRGVCSFAGTKKPYDVPPGGRAEIELAGQAPYLGAEDSMTMVQHALVYLSEDALGPALVLPLAVTAVRPIATELSVAGAPRAGEMHLAKVTVTNHRRAVSAPTVLLDVPGDWGVSPGRRVRLRGMQAGERRVVTFLCSVPRDAMVGRARVSASVVQGGAAEHVDVQPPRPQAKAPHRNGAPAIDGDLADWQAIEPVVLGERHVRIEGWKGKADCSARVWTGWDERHLFVAAEVTDDAFEQKQRGHPIWQGDCIQMALCPGPPRSESGYGGVVEFGLALTPQGPQVWQWIPEAHEVGGAKLVVKRSGGKLVYEAAIPWASLGSWRPTPKASAGWSFTVNDADGEGFEGWLEWTPGVCGSKDAAGFGRLLFEGR